MSQVSIIDIEGNHPQIPTEFIADIGSAIPIANILEVLGDTVPAGVLPVYTSAGGNTVTVNVQISQAIAASNSLNVGLSAFNSAHFDVDANGFVSLLGSGVGSFNVDANTAPGTDPVVPNGSGIITVTGGQVPTGNIGINVIRTNSLAASTYTIEIQQSSTSAAKDTSINGVSHYNSAQFTVDEGFVSLIGGDAAIDQVLVDQATAPGVNPVTPDGSGEITVSADLVVAHSVPIETHTRALNTYNIEPQISSVAAASNVTQNGMAHYNSGSFTIDANGFVSLIGYANPSVTNLGVSLSGATFSITSASGAALSATNRAIVVLPSVSVVGGSIAYSVTANISFQGASGTDDMGGNTFGTTTSVAWSSAMPFYLYAVPKSDETAVTFMLSRVPHALFAPAAGSIAQAGSAVAAQPYDFFAIDSSINVADYAIQPCRAIGSIRMTKDSSDGWTVSALSADNDGIGFFQDTTFFNMPLNQNGAVANGIRSTVGGDTLPAWTGTGIAYKIQRDGYCFYSWVCNNVSTLGAGTGIIQWFIPMPSAYTGVIGKGSPTNYSFYNGATYDTGVCRYQSSRINHIQLLPSGTGVAFLTSAYFGSAKSLGFIEMYYPIARTSAS